MLLFLADLKICSTWRVATWMSYKGEGGTTKCDKQWLARANPLPKRSNETDHKYESFLICKILRKANCFIMMTATVTAAISTLGNL